MKKTTPGKQNGFRLATILLSFLLLADSASAACESSTWKYCNPLEGTVGSLVEAATKMTQALLGLIGTIALLFLVYAGIVYMTAAGDDSKIKSAKNIITGTVAGLGIALIAYSLLVTLSEIMGVR